MTHLNKYFLIYPHRLTLPAVFYAALRALTASSACSLVYCMRVSVPQYFLAFACDRLNGTGGRMDWIGILDKENENDPPRPLFHRLDNI